jgi:hypothetical protein
MDAARGALGLDQIGALTDDQAVLEWLANVTNA